MVIILQCPKYYQILLKSTGTSMVSILFNVVLFTVSFILLPSLLLFVLQESGSLIRLFVKQTFICIPLLYIKYNECRIIYCVSWRLRLWCETSLFTILQFNRGGQFYWLRKPECQKKSTDQITDKLYHIMLYWVRLAMNIVRDRRGGDRMVVAFTTTYHHWCEFESRSRRGA